MRRKKGERVENTQHHHPTPQPNHLQASVIVINLLAGPPLFRSAVVALGEARALPAVDDASPPRPGGGMKPGSGPSSPADGSVRPRSPRGVALSPAGVRAQQKGEV